MTAMQFVFIVAAVITAIVLVAREVGRRKDAAAGEQFKEKYGASLQRFLDESPVDREEVRRIRGKGTKFQIFMARRYVQKHDFVPAKVAREFAKRA